MNLSLDLVWPVLLSVFGTIAGGVGVRRMISADGRARARDGAEGGYFGTALGELTLERNEWKVTATDAWARVNVLTVENAVLTIELRHARSQLVFQARLIRKYPDLAGLFETSRPVNLDTRTQPIIATSAAEEDD